MPKIVVEWLNLEFAFVLVYIQLHIDLFPKSVTVHITSRLKYIMLLKLLIILSGNSFNFYLLFPKLFPTFYCKYIQLCYKNYKPYL